MDSEMILCCDLLQHHCFPYTDITFLKKVLEKEGEIDPENVNIVEVKAIKNVLQGILSTTYVVDVDFEAPNENGEKGKTRVTHIKVFTRDHSLRGYSLDVCTPCMQVFGLY